MPCTKGALTSTRAAASVAPPCRPRPSVGDVGGGCNWLAHRKFLMELLHSIGPAACLQAVALLVSRFVSDFSCKFQSMGRTQSGDREHT